jgi:hypothetical protein
MISEAIKTLQQMSDEQKRLRHLPELTNSYYHYFDDGKGEIVAHVRLPRDRNHEVGDLSSLVDAIERYSSDCSSCWVSMDAVRVVLDDDEIRCDSINLPLQPHEAFAVLEGKAWLEQRAMVDLVRHNLADCTLSPDWTLDALRTMTFRAGHEQTGRHSDHAASLGKSITAEVTGTDKLPKTVQVEFHPFPSLSDELDVAVTVHCTLFTDAVSCLIQLAPQPGQIDQAKRTALLGLKKLLDTSLAGVRTVKELAVLIGRP